MDNQHHHHHHLYHHHHHHLYHLHDHDHHHHHHHHHHHLLQVVTMTNWNYYESVRRFQRILEARGISKALRAAGATQGDLVMVGDWDFNYWEPKNRWIAELGLEEVNPRLRPGLESKG